MTWFIQMLMWLECHSNVAAKAQKCWPLFHRNGWPQSTWGSHWTCCEARSGCVCDITFTMPPCYSHQKTASNVTPITASIDPQSLNPTASSLPRNHQLTQKRLCCLCSPGVWRCTWNAFSPWPQKSVKRSLGSICDSGWMSYGFVWTWGNYTPLYTQNSTGWVWFIIIFHHVPILSRSNNHKLEIIKPTCFQVPPSACP